MFVRVFLTFGVIAAVRGIDRNAVVEMESSQLNPTVNMTWLGAQTIFYYPLMDLLDVWAFAKDARGEAFANSNSASEIIKLGCNTWTPPSQTTFFGVRVLFDVVITTEEVVYKKQGTEEPWRRFRYEFTDNKSFVLGTNSFDNGAGAAGWILLTTTPTISKDVETKILHRLSSLGFSHSNVVRPPNAKICSVPQNVGIVDAYGY